MEEQEDKGTLVTETIKKEGVVHTCTEFYRRGRGSGYTESSRGVVDTDSSLQVPSLLGYPTSLSTIYDLGSQHRSQSLNIIFVPKAPEEGEIDRTSPSSNLFPRHTPRP